jgi:hypothetical protein
VKLTLRIEYLPGSGEFTARSRELQYAGRGTTPDLAVSALMAHAENNRLILLRGEKERMGLSIAGVVDEEDYTLQCKMKNSQQKAAFQLLSLALLRRGLNGESLVTIAKELGTSKSNVGKRISRVWAKARRYMESNGTILPTLTSIYTYDELRKLEDKSELLAALYHFERTLRSRIQNPMEHLRKAIMGHSYTELAKLEGATKAAMGRTISRTWARAVAYSKASGKIKELIGMDRIEDIRAGSLIALQVVGAYEEFVKKALLK